MISRFTSAAASEFHPLWTPDGIRVNLQQRHRRTLRQAGVRRRERRRNFSALETAAANDWSPDGKTLVYTTNDPNPSRDVWACWRSTATEHPSRWRIRHSTSATRSFRLVDDGSRTRRMSPAAMKSTRRDFPSAAAACRFQMVVAAWSVGGAMGRKFLYRHRWLAHGGAGHTGEGRQRIGGREGRCGSSRPRVGGPVQTNSRQQDTVSPDGQRFLMNTLARRRPFRLRWS